MCILTIFAQIWSKCHGIIPIFLYFGVLYFLPVTLPFFNIFWGLQTCHGSCVEVKDNSWKLVLSLDDMDHRDWTQVSFFHCYLASSCFFGQPTILAVIWGPQFVFWYHIWKRRLQFVSILLDRIYSKFGLQGNFPGRPGKAVFLGRPLSFLYVELPPPLNKALR